MPAGNADYEYPLIFLNKIFRKLLSIILEDLKCNTEKYL